MLPFIRSGLALCAMLVASTAVGLAQAIALPEPVGMDGDPAARFVLDGNSAFLGGDLQTAARDYRLATRRKPGFAVATFNLGLVEVHEGQQARGLADMDRGIALATQHGMAPAYITRLKALRSAFTAQHEST